MAKMTCEVLPLAVVASAPRPNAKNYVNLRKFYPDWMNEAIDRGDLSLVGSLDFIGAVRVRTAHGDKWAFDGDSVAMLEDGSLDVVKG